MLGGRESPGIGWYESTLLENHGISGEVLVIMSKMSKRGFDVYRAFTCNS
jgi:hypothetical protein